MRKFYLTYKPVTSPLIQYFSLLEWLLLLSCWSMFIGFLCSRVVMSVGMISLILIGFRPMALREGWEKFKLHPFCWFACLFFIGYLISGFWSNNSESWAANAQLKLPFLLLPFAMLNLPFHKKKIFLWVVSGCLIFLMIGVLYSSSFLILHPDKWLFSGSHLPSPTYSDYIRFTISLVLAIQMIFYLLKKSNGFQISKTGKYSMIAWIVVVVIYLHIQAVKSGLICFYSLMLINAGYVLVKKQKHGWWKALGIAGTLGLILLLSIKFVPTLQNQMNRVERGIAIWQNNDTAKYETNSSIIPRLVSYEAAWKSIQKHPLTGIGAGDWVKVVHNQYERYFPFMGKYQLIPHNQYICSAFLIGIPFSIFLLLLIIWPFFRIKDIAVLATASVMIIGTMVEAMLEVQYGVFVFLFFTLFWMSALQYKKREKSAQSRYNDLHADTSRTLYQDKRIANRMF